MPINRDDYPQVPHDFPITPVPSALSGAQPKLSLVEENGKFYAPGTSPSEISQAFEVCDDLVTQMVPYCQRKLTAFGGDQIETAKAAFQGLLNKNWCTPEQSAWIMLKVAAQLSWQLREDQLRR